MSAGMTAAVLEALTQTVTQDAPFSVASYWQSLNYGDPGPTGANEITNGTGAGARQLATFSGSGGTDTNSDVLTYTVPSGVTVSWVGIWTEQVGGTFLGGFPVVGQLHTCVSLGGQSILYAPAHGLTVGLPVRLFTLPGVPSSIPSPFLGDTVYLVTAVPSADTLQLIEAGSTVITPNSSAAFMVAQDLSQTFPLGGIVTFPVSTGIVYSTVG